MASTDFNVGDVEGQISALNDQIGNLSNLKTTDKTSMVVATNELYNKVIYPNSTVEKVSNTYVSTINSKNAAIIGDCFIFSFVFLINSAPTNGTNIFSLYKDGTNTVKAASTTYFIAQPLDGSTSPVFLQVDANSSYIKCAYAPDAFVASKWYTISGVVRIS